MILSLEIAPKRWSGLMIAGDLKRQRCMDYSNIVSSFQSSASLLAARKADVCMSAGRRNCTPVERLSR
jgi:hypothetical protein